MIAPLPDTLLVCFWDIIMRTVMKERRLLRAKTGESFVRIEDCIVKCGSRPVRGGILVDWSAEVTLT